MPNPHDTQEPQTLIATKETKYGTVIVDARDADLLTGASVFMGGSRSAYAQNYLGRDGAKTIRKYTHRLILSRVMGRELDPSEEVDHLNGSGLDNRRVNLRLATSVQNHGNTRRSKSNTSGFKGVSLCKPTGKWRATICVQNRTIHLGYFTDPAEAHDAYMTAARAYFGEFANDGTSK